MKLSSSDRTSEVDDTGDEWEVISNPTDSDSQKYVEEVGEDLDDWLLVEMDSSPMWDQSDFLVPSGSGGTGGTRTAALGPRSSRMVQSGYQRWDSLVAAGYSSWNAGVHALTRRRQKDLDVGNGS